MTLIYCVKTNKIDAELILPKYSILSRGSDKERIFVTIYGCFWHFSFFISRRPGFVFDLFWFVDRENTKKFISHFWVLVWVSKKLRVTCKIFGGVYLVMDNFNVLFSFFGFVWIILWGLFKILISDFPIIYTIICFL